jgi:hypothetical protein
MLNSPWGEGRGSMTPERLAAKGSVTGVSPDGLRVSPSQAMVIIAERELERALVEQSRSATGMYANPSIAEQAALQRAVEKICHEAHRLDLKAEELIVGVKEAWSQLAHVRARHLGDRDRDTLREIVSSTIEVFFEKREASADEPRD